MQQRETSLCGQDSWVPVWYSDRPQSFPWWWVLCPNSPLPWAAHAQPEWAKLGEGAGVGRFASNPARVFGTSFHLVGVSILAVVVTMNPRYPPAAQP